ncbi:hypothetical protein EC970264_4661 [Escherichia coli 97.0264]|nr:hypothetical protein EC970264_4661 [Escherichia coli 97.0264]
MNGFKNDMDDEKSQKGNGSTGHSNKTSQTKRQKLNQNAFWRCESTTMPKPTA